MRFRHRSGIYLHFFRLDIFEKVLFNNSNIVIRMIGKR